MPIIGLEPSCLLTLRDELLSLRNDDAAKSVAAQAVLFEEFLVREAESGRLKLPLQALKKKALLHGHCHQKSFGAFKPVEKVLRLVPDLEVQTIESSCCGMAGAFGYGAETFEASMQMAELSLLPAVQASRGRRPHRRRRLLMPPPDRRRRRARGAARRPRAGDELEEQGVGTRHCERSEAIQLRAKRANRKPRNS